MSRVYAKVVIESYDICCCITTVIEQTFIVFDKLFMSE